MKVFCIPILWFCVLLVQAQQDPLVLSQDKFLYILENYHPVAVRANLLEAKGQQEIRKAKGNFDPKLESDFNQKTFDGKDYYTLFNGGLKVPTWYGIEFKAGIDQNQGTYLNAQDNVPTNGLAYAGVSVPIGKNLVIDKRRTVLKQAKLFSEATVVQKNQIMNNLYFEGLNAYWDWVMAWNEYQIYEQGLALVQTRFQAVKQSFKFGDKPAIDTLEAYIQVQDRKVNRNQALLAYQNAGVELSNYLWTQDFVPLEVTDKLHPSTEDYIEPLKKLEEDVYLNQLLNMELSHPEMQYYDYKRNHLVVEEKLKLEAFKPQVNLNYHALNEPIGNSPLTGYSSQNYKWGVAFTYPLFLRKEIGDLQLTRIKMQELEYSQSEKLLQLQNKVKSYYNKHLNLQEQVKVTRSIVKSYEKLLLGEKQKFDAGESSLFLVNTREKNLIKARLKLNETITKYHIAHAGVLWASGVLYRGIDKL